MTKANDQAPDGTRVDNKGLKWYPPAGNGILAASQGYFPKKGSIMSGDLTTDAEEGIKVSAPDEGTPVAGVEAKKGGAEENSDVAAGKWGTLALLLWAWSVL